jgi:hypothetical protein
MSLRFHDKVSDRDGDGADENLSGEGLVTN